MMNKTTPHEAAFPLAAHDGYDPRFGLTKLEHMATQLMAAAIGRSMGVPGTSQELAQRAVADARELIKALNADLPMGGML